MKDIFFAVVDFKKRRALLGAGRGLFKEDFMNTNLTTHTPIAEEERILLNRCRNGERSAFDDLVRTHWRRIFNRALALLKNHEDAEEITQDTFIRAQNKLGDFRGEASLKTWLYKIATNLSLNRLAFWRRRGRGVSISLDAPYGDDEINSTLHDVVPSDAPSPGEEVVTREFVSAVEQAMGKISDEHREILTLRNIQNLSYEEIAQKLGINVGTVKSRIARARKSLFNAMGADFH